MKLYEAIELGSGLVKEVHNTFLESDGKGICGCALGAAYMALFPFKEFNICNGADMVLEMKGKIPTSDVTVKCPECKTEKYQGWKKHGVQLECMVNHLHAHHNWTRQKIAEWLKPIEDEYERQHPALDVENLVPERIES